MLRMWTDTPEEHAPGTDVGCGGETVDVGLPGEILVQLAETLGNPLALLVSKAHLSKAFCEAARNAQALLKQLNLREWATWRMVDDALVAALVARCTQLSSLNLGGCRRVTDASLHSVASGSKLFTTLGLTGCRKITDAAVVAVASECKQLTTLNLEFCGMSSLMRR